MNEALDRQVAELESLLEATLSIDDYIGFESLKTEPDIAPFDLGGAGGFRTSDHTYRGPVTTTGGPPSSSIQSESITQPAICG